MQLAKLREWGYGEREILCVTAFLEDVDTDRVEWYCVVARKGR